VGASSRSLLGRVRGPNHSPPQPPANLLADSLERWSAPTAFFGAKPHWRPGTAESCCSMGGPGLSHFRVVHPGPPATRDRLSHARRLRSVGLLTVEQQNLLVLTVVPQMTPTAQFLRLQRWFGTNHDGLALSDNILRSTCRITIPNSQEVEAASIPFVGSHDPATGRIRQITICAGKCSVLCAGMGNLL
jgi:hypothetical protein